MAKNGLGLEGGRTLAGKHNTDFPLRHLRSLHPPRTEACSAKANKRTHTWHKLADHPNKVLALLALI